MRLLKDRIDWYCKELIAGGHHLVPMQERINLWLGELGVYTRREDIAKEVQIAQDRNNTPGPMNWAVAPPEMVKAITILTLYAGEVGMPAELMYAELRLLQSAPGRDQVELK